MRRFLQVLFFFLPLCFGLRAQSPVGRWLMVDDRTGTPKNEVEMYLQNGKLYGKVAKHLVASSNHLCDKCTDYRKNQPMLGMIVIEELELANGYWQNGRALFPKQGKWYDLDVWLSPGDPNTLVLRGYWGPLFRTQYWKRVL
ncbi:MAG: DUF2147 domain-containing protein [Lewinellaceae bacterium]|nr:DUF2147 domain-containing protein [Lewinellaceae bacterium]